MWIRQSFREDGQPSSPVSLEEQTIEGPLHEGTYAGHCLSGDDVYEAVMTLDQAKQWLHQHPEALGFTFQSDRRDPVEPVRCWFKSRSNPNPNPNPNPNNPNPDPNPDRNPSPNPATLTRTRFKSRLRVLYHPSWWTVSMGRGMD